MNGICVQERSCSDMSSDTVAVARNGNEDAGGYIEAMASMKVAARAHVRARAARKSTCINNYLERVSDGTLHERLSEELLATHRSGNRAWRMRSCLA